MLIFAGWPDSPIVRTFSSIKKPVPDYVQRSRRFFRGLIYTCIDQIIAYINKRKYVHH